MKQVSVGDVILTANDQSFKAKFCTDIYIWGKNHFGQLGIPRKEISNKNETVSKDELKSKMDPQLYISPVEASFDMAVV